MASLNHVVLIGALGKDPEIRYTQSGTAVASFSMATSEKIKGDEKTEWHNITAWGKTAEICGEYLSKGKQCCVTGKIQTRKWQDRDGKDHYSTEIVAERVVLLGGKAEKGARQQEEPSFDPDEDCPF